MVVISIEGLMGAGKTTLLEKLEKMGYKVFRERTAEWTFLDKFYEDPKRYALVFQIEVLLSHLKYEFGDDPSEIIFTERCPDISYSVFSKILSSDGILTDDDCLSYKKIYDTLAPWRPDMHIFLKAPLDVCESRVNRRRDTYEISQEYMKKVDRYYNIYNKFSDIPVKTISSEATVEAIANEVIDIVKGCLT